MLFQFTGKWISNPPYQAGSQSGKEKTHFQISEAEILNHTDCQIHTDSLICYDNTM